MTDRIPLGDLTSDQLDALYERLEAAEETELARQLATCNEAFASATFRAAKAEARVTELEAEREKDAAINAQVDAKTEEQLNGVTEVAQYFKALSERTQAWGDQHRDRANRYRARTDAVKAELHALNSETRGLNPVALAGRRDAVARIRAALQTISHDTPVPDDPRVTELEQRAEQAEAANTTHRALLEEARDALEAAGAKSAHGDDWPRLVPAIEELAERAEQAAAAGLREADWIVEHCPDHGCVEPETDVCHCEIADRLRLMADEPQQPTTTA